jgi:hypothetical protein
MPSCCFRWCCQLLPCCVGPWCGVVPWQPAQEPAAAKDSSSGRHSAWMCSCWGTMASGRGLHRAHKQPWSPTAPEQPWQCYGTSSRFQSGRHPAVKVQQRQQSNYCHHRCIQHTPNTAPTHCNTAHTQFSKVRDYPGEMKCFFFHIVHDVSEPGDVSTNDAVTVPLQREVQSTREHSKLRASSSSDIHHMRPHAGSDKTQPAAVP